MKIWNWRTKLIDMDLPSIAKHVGLTLAVYMNEYGEGAFPSIRTLEKKTGYSRPTIVKALDILIEKKVLTKERRTRDDGSFSSNTYSMSYEGMVKDVNHPSKGGELGVVKEVNSINSSINNTPTEQKIYTKRFEDFWKVYKSSRKGSKEKASKAYDKALERDTAENILKGAKAYSLSAEAKGKYGKGCAAWLNDDRWLNEYKREEVPTDYETAPDIFGTDKTLAELKKEADEQSPF